MINGRPKKPGQIIPNLFIVRLLAPKTLTKTKTLCRIATVELSVYSQLLLDAGNAQLSHKRRAQKQLCTGRREEEERCVR